MAQDIVTEAVCRFLDESNRIEGEPLAGGGEVDTALSFLAQQVPTLAGLERYVYETAPGAELRDRVGRNVTVGNHAPPRGGPEIRKALEALLCRAHRHTKPYVIHHQYETLHPFMDGNGRSGRLLWIWMHLQCETYMGIGFLHQWYYESLDAGLGGGGRR